MMVLQIILLGVVWILAKPALKNCPRCQGSGTCCTLNDSTCNCGVWDRTASVMRGNKAGTCTCTR